MRRCGFLILAIFAAATVTACSPPSPPPPAPPTPAAQTLSQSSGALPTDASAAASPNAQAAPVAAASDSGFPNIPAGAQWTLFCLTIDGATHVPDSERLKAQLIAKTHSRDWYVLHGENQSTLYYGFYKTYDDKSQPAEMARAQADRKMITQMRDDSGNTPFASCIFQPLSGPDPSAPPEWDLRNAPGYWALQIAAYKGSPDRKRYAVDAVRQARAMGIQAYYYHGASISTVLIGSWPIGAVQAQDASVAHSDNPNKPVLVLPAPLPPGYKNDLVVDGKDVKVMVPRVQVLDPSLIAAMKQYPANAVNGEVIMHKVQTANGIVEEPDPSFLVQIPHDDQGAGTPPAPAAAAGN
ncbi:MAG: hypothetical protein ABSH22_03015 [Tepidisphaeraceae bacterium]